MKLRCPVCKRYTSWKDNPWRPFCSERCKMIDLGRWAMEEYRIEGKKIKESDREGEDQAYHQEEPE